MLIFGHKIYVRRCSETFFNLSYPAVTTRYLYVYVQLSFTKTKRSKVASFSVVPDVVCVLLTPIIAENGYARRRDNCSSIRIVSYHLLISRRHRRVPLLVLYDGDVLDAAVVMRSVGIRRRFVIHVRLENLNNCTPEDVCPPSLLWIRPGSLGLLRRFV